MAGGLWAVFKALAEDAAQAGRNVGEALAGFFGKTASNEEESVTRTLEAEAENVNAISAIREDAAGQLDASLAGFKRDWPADPVTGEALTHRDLDFLDLTEQQVEWWRNGDAPLGMTPETYREWAKDMQDALREDGIPPETVDVRLLGSSARGFSGPHKLLPTDSEIVERYPPDVARSALASKAEWLGEDTGRLRSMPFDSMSKLGLGEPSDYDVNISSDLMVDAARAQWQANGEPVPFLSGDHEYVNKEVAGATFPYLQDWGDRWSALLGRDVSWAVFPGTGPKDVSASGHFVHFQDDDWIVQKPGDS